MRKILATAALLGASLWAAQPVLAHPHQAEHAHHGAGQVIANGQNHPGFDGALSCESFGGAGGVPYGPAWYGLETAHHGPDAGNPGKADNACYQTTGGVHPSQDVANPVIR